jgi:LmbE family N-acetylglucosaminyl deacetylase
MTIRQATCRALERALHRRLAPFAADDWAASALVVAPHPDDETLGCGGVICKKIAAGAEVRFVFVTDGAASHRLEEGAATLARRRAQEAREAARCLGVAADRVSFLNIPDGRAADHRAAIVDGLAALLRDCRPQAVFVVHGGDPPPDHRAVFAALSEAIRLYGRPVTVFEYPVWYWYHWPWVALRGDLPGMWRTNLRQTARTLAGLRSLTRLNVLADVSDVADRKRRALDAHRSQTERPDGHPDWPVLSDLGRGDFLARLTGDCELFLRYEANA